MKNFISLFKLTLAAALFFQFGCNDEQEISEPNNVTDELAKIETSYQEGALKVETAWDYVSPKIETRADDATREAIYAALNSSSETKKMQLKSYSNPVGVIQSGWCDPSKLLTIFMDCEDHNQKTATSGWHGNIDNDSNGNLTFKFCIVDGTLLSRIKYNYAVLDLSGVLPNGIIGAIRLFDNEDDDNKNSATVNGVAISGSMGTCSFGKNIYLGFQFYPALASSQATTLPDLGIGLYGVFGKFTSTSMGYVLSDDEDNRNVNRFTTTLSTSQYTSFIEPGDNTYLYTSRAF